MKNALVKSDEMFIKGTKNIIRKNKIKSGYFQHILETGHSYDKTAVMHILHINARRSEKN
jgi:hypothetical protein